MCFQSSKIRQFNRAISVDQNIPAFDVSMQDIIRVEVLKSEENLPGVNRHDILIEFPEFLEHLAYRTTWDVLWNDIDASLVFIELACDEFDDIQMLQMMKLFDFDLQLFDFLIEFSLRFKFFDRFDRIQLSCINIERLEDLTVGTTINHVAFLKSELSSFI